jgi:DNA-binding NtrC family response regulator
MEDGEKRLSILIYTGDHDLAESLTLLLQDQYCVHSTSVIAQAIDTVRRGELDLLIADFGLSLEEGSTALEQMRKENPKVPIIVFCPYQLKNSKIERQIRGQVNSYLHVPVNVDEIVDAIATLIDVKKKKGNSRLVYTHN